MSLRDVKTGNIVAIDELGSLQDIQSESAVFSQEKDFISYIEVAELEAGMYELEILVLKALFIPTKNYQTCLTFDFVLEYVSRSTIRADSD